MARWGFGALVCGIVLGCATCVFNPQPEPPGAQADSTGGTYGGGTGAGETTTTNPTVGGSGGCNQGDGSGANSAKQAAADGILANQPFNQQVGGAAGAAGMAGAGGAAGSAGAAGQGGG